MDKDETHGIQIVSVNPHYRFKRNKIDNRVSRILV